MRKPPVVLVLILLTGAIVNAQTRRTTRPSTRAVKQTPAAVKPAPSTVDRGEISGRTYANRSLGFELTLPDTWLIAGDDFYAFMKSKGIDLTPRPPRAANPLAQKKVDAAFKRLKVLLTAFRSLPGTSNNASLRIAFEEVRLLDTNRPVKDAVDYVDLMRSQIKAVQMPAGYTYSDTQAEQLGRNQFAFIDSADKQAKTRIYVTVRKGFAILFSLNYVESEDLETFRDILARASFALQ